MDFRPKIYGDWGDRNCQGSMIWWVWIMVSRHVVFLLDIDFWCFSTLLLFSPCPCWWRLGSLSWSCSIDNFIVDRVLVWNKRFLAGWKVESDRWNHSNTSCAVPNECSCLNLFELRPLTSKTHASFDPWWDHDHFRQPTNICTISFILITQNHNQTLSFRMELQNYFLRQTAIPRHQTSIPRQPHRLSSLLGLMPVGLRKFCHPLYQRRKFARRHRRRWRREKAKAGAHRRIRKRIDLSQLHHSQSHTRIHFSGRRFRIWQWFRRRIDLQWKEIQGRTRGVGIEAWSTGGVVDGK